MPADLSRYRDLIEEKQVYAALATVMPDGSPQVTPVWFDYKDGRIRVNTAKGRIKARNMREGTPVALSLLDPDNAYRYVQIRGRVVRITEDGADQHIDQLSRKYLGKDYPWHQPDAVRVIYEIEPATAHGMG